MRGNCRAAWPKSCAVPVPDDPLTGRPFDYAIRDGVGLLGSAAGAEPAEQNLEVRYELRLAR